ncbi:hypothetical protein DYE49_05715 [Treponema rectale]|uniref:ABC-type uncharacterized transport system domain-containing protein n=2 Tax=Treponema rectale TaxID=744512 RepID=A0A7M1XJU3_9SPIR|nr:hypothetical protein DYE49_05715 [Treponema rectale]
MISLIKYHVFKFLISPAYFFITAVYVISSGLYFFISSRFFTPAGTSDLQGFFLALSTLNILYFPLCTSYAAFSKDDYRLPFSSLKVTAAKIISCVAAYLFTLLQAMLIPFCVFLFGTPDLNSFICSMIIMLLYSTACFSFTVFTSVFFSRASVSFTVSSLILIITNIIHILPQYTDFIFSYSALNYFSFAWHFDAAGKGIADTSDISFFLITAGAFTVLTSVIMERKREPSDRYLFHKTAVTIITAVLLLILSIILIHRFDFTSSKKYTFSELTENTAESVSQPLSVTYYRSQTLLDRYPTLKDTEYLLRQWASLNSNISLEIKEASDTKTKKLLETEGIPAQQIETTTSESESFTTVYSAIVMDYGADRSIIPYLLDPSSLEYNLTRYTANLTERKTDYVMIVCGNGARLDQDYSYMMSYLINQGFTPVEFYISSAVSDRETQPLITDILNSGNIPEAPLIIMGTSEFSKEETDALERYILSGGKAFIATQNYTVNILDGWEIIKGNEYFKRMLFTFGIYLDEDPVCDEQSLKISSAGQAETSLNAINSKSLRYPLWPELSRQKNAPLGLIQFWPSGIVIDEEVSELENYRAEPYLYTSEKSWHLKPYDGKYTTSTSARYTPDEKYFTAVTSAVITKTNKKVPDLIVYGDQYGFNTQILNVISSSVPDFRTLNFLSDSILKLTGREELSELKYKFTQTNTLNKMQNENRSESKNRVYTLIIILPVILNIAAYCAVRFYRRRRFYEKNQY